MRARTCAFHVYSLFQGRLHSMSYPQVPYNIANAFGGLPVLTDSVPTNPRNSDQSVRDTIAKMVSIARASSHSDLVKAAVQDAVRGLNGNSTDEEIAKEIFYWVKAHVKFVEDETINALALGMDEYSAMDTELLITPEALLSMPQPMGDCDDFSTLTAAMLLVLDFNCAFVTIAADKSDPTMLSHVYVKVWLADENKGMYLDCSHGPFPGWETSEYTRKIEWAIN